MPSPKVRNSIPHLHGIYILEQVPRYDYHDDREMTPVTKARQFARKHKIKGPAVFFAKRTEFTVDYFYLGRDGMYTLEYAERNWQTFPELLSMVRRMKEEGSYTYEPEMPPCRKHLPIKEPFYA